MLREAWSKQGFRALQAARYCRKRGRLPAFIGRNPRAPGLPKYGSRERLIIMSFFVAMLVWFILALPTALVIGRHLRGRKQSSRDPRQPVTFRLSPSVGADAAARAPISAARGMTAVFQRNEESAAGPLSA